MAQPISDPAGSAPSGDVAREPYRLWRIGFLTHADRITPDAISGMPYQIFQALRGLVGMVEPIVPGQGVGPAPALSGLRSLLPRARRKIADRLRFPDGTLKVLDKYAPGRVRRQMLARSRSEAAAVQAAIANTPYDAIISVVGSWYLHALHTPVPIVHFSDATTRLVNRLYAERSSRSLGYQQAWEDMEVGTFRRAAVVALATDETKRSAIEDYGVDPARVIVAPMGATVMPEPGRIIRPDPPTDRHLRLCIVAGDPVRKRVAFALECVDRLAEMGWDAELAYIGPPIEALAASPRLRGMGRLRLSSPADRAVHTSVLADSHMMILPSLAEAAGIAPAEAAHFGRPSIVSCAGGLPTMVKHGQTGIVMPMSATPADYAREIDALCRDRHRYEAMSQAALTRAQNELTWTGCARRMLEALVPLVGKPSLKLVRH